MPKKIIVKCHGPISINSEYQSPWEDVWLSWTDKPRRTKYYCGPTLICKPTLESDLKISLECKKDYADNNYDLQNGFDKEIEEYTNALAILEHIDIHIPIFNDDIPNIYTSKDYIDRQEAERMIAELMKVYGYDDIVCKWKRSKFVIIPM